jgi:predicted esterase
MNFADRRLRLVSVCASGLLAACAAKNRDSNELPRGAEPGGDAGSTYVDAGHDPAVRDGAAGDAAAKPDAALDPCGGAIGLVISTPLALATPTLSLGDTLRGTVTYKNCSSGPVSVAQVVLTSRPPGGTHANGPYDHLSPAQAATTIPPGTTITVSGSRRLATTDPVGNWISYATYQDTTGAWHDGPDVAFTVSGNDGGTPTVVGSDPTNPIDGFTPDETFTLNSGQSDYYVSVPTSYDPSHKTPMTLFVWLHGCGGQGLYDAGMVSPGQRGQSQDWITIALGGREGGCWQPKNDVPWVLAAIADVETRFNVNTKRVILGGYSSGGDLGYPTVFLNAGLFAGILIENSDPFDNGYDANMLLAAASWKVNVVHLAHLQDTTYPIDTVRAELGQVKSAGFPVTLIERAGTHYDGPGAMVKGQSVPGTEADLQSVLLPYIDAGWSTP